MVSLFTNVLKSITCYNQNNHHLLYFIIADCLATMSTTLHMTDPEPGHPDSDTPDVTDVMHTKCHNGMHNQATISLDKL